MNPVLAININEINCIRCGRCVEVCPVDIFRQREAKGPIDIQHPQSCIVCGHCVATCPTESVLHTSFPPEKVHPIDRHQLPSAEQVMTLCQARRSNRAFSNKPVPREALEQIVKAAHRAPTASNTQAVSFTVVTDPDMLRRITNLTLDIYGELIRLLENPLLRPILKHILKQGYHYLPTFHRLIDAQAKGTDLILRGATALVLIHTPAQIRFGKADANLAYENGSLMAESLGVSQFYTGYICSAFDNDRKGRFQKLLGIEGEKLQAGMALGMPKFRFSNYIDKKPLNVKWI